MTHDRDLPRRCYVDLLTPEELLIRDAVIAVEKMVAESVEHAFDDLAQRQWIETKRKSGDMLGATRKALAQVGALIVPAEVAEIEALMHGVEKAL